MNHIIGLRVSEQGDVTIDWVDGVNGHRDFEEIRSTFLSVQTQAKYEYIGGLIESIISDSLEVLDLIHKYKSGNMVSY